MLSDQEPPQAVGFDAHVVTEDGHPVVVIRGEIDLAVADQLDAVLARAIEAGPRITLDLRDTSFMGSTGINALVAAHNRLGQIPETIVLRDPTPAVRRVLAVAGIDHLFNLQSTRSRAAAH
jgi:stage II sporulation protein AA (anti-sigma F factor antagonist)